MKIRLTKIQDTLVINVWNLFLNLLHYKEPRPCYTSANYGITTSTLQDFWFEIGKKESLVQVILNNTKSARCFSIEEMIQRVAVLEFGNSTVVALYNVEPSAIGRLSDRVPKGSASFLMEDVILIPVPNRNAALKISTKVSSDIADLIVIDRGFVVPQSLVYGEVP